MIHQANEYIIMVEHFLIIAGVVAGLIRSHTNGRKIEKLDDFVRNGK